MGVVVSLPLFGFPGQELGEESAVRGQQLRALAGELHERLHRAADLVDRLAAAGWDARVALHDVMLSRRGVETREEALRQLKAAGVDPEELVIVEEIDEEELGHS